MLFYHGTSLESAKNIMRYGFCNTIKTWQCSQADKIYMVAADDRFYDCSEAVLFALEAGQIAAAVQGSNETSVAVFEFDISDDIAEDYFLPDVSCESMDGCWCINTDTLNKLIKEHKINMRVKVLQDAYTPYLRIMYLAYLKNTYVIYKDDKLEEACRHIRESNIDTEWLYDFDNVCDNYEYYDDMEDYENVYFA